MSRTGAPGSGWGNVRLEPELTALAIAGKVRFFQFGDRCDATEKNAGCYTNLH